MSGKSKSSDWNEPTRRFWKKGDRAKVSLMQVFRSAYWEHDAKRAQEKIDAGGEEVSEISRRSRQRREGISENVLRAHLQSDLNALLNTTRLDAATPLDEAPNVADSILNYGFLDMSTLTASDLDRPEIAASIKESLLRHEPRLIAETVEVTMSDTRYDRNQKLSISIRAELMGDPVDIPVDFNADVDLGAGKMSLSRLKVQS